MKAKAIVLAMVMASFFASCSSSQTETTNVDTIVVTDTIGLDTFDIQNREAGLNAQIVN